MKRVTYEVLILIGIISILLLSMVFIGNSFGDEDTITFYDGTNPQVIPWEELDVPVDTVLNSVNSPDPVLFIEHDVYVAFKQDGLYVNDVRQMVWKKTNETPLFVYGDGEATINMVQGDCDESE